MTPVDSPRFLFALLADVPFSRPPLIIISPLRRMSLSNRFETIVKKTANCVLAEASRDLTIVQKTRHQKKESSKTCNDGDAHNGVVSDLSNDDLSCNLQYMRRSKPQRSHSLPYKRSDCCQWISKRDGHGCVQMGRKHFHGQLVCRQHFYLLTNQATKTNTREALPEPQIDHFMDLPFDFEFPLSFEEDDFICNSPSIARRRAPPQNDLDVTPPPSIEDDSPSNAQKEIPFPKDATTATNILTRCRNYFMGEVD